ncbi:MAG: ATP-dependent RNA helicase HrpA [Gammaproteobacteria bacterium]|nr:ATP-dependent RNA helicase HrpA [Gammaproteobacteria bacterium]
MSTSIADLIPQCMLVDQLPLSNWVEHSNHSAQVPKKILDKIEHSINRRRLREQNLPRPEYLLNLPIVQEREKLLATIAANQVVIVCGETGSGKTTQLPKLCLELGRGISGLIGHTQPRRIAARSLAARIAEELHSQVGKAVGYKMRFSDQVSPDSYIKVMTDGILLAETQSDPRLLAYDTLIIDEAHERSLNIDFILGYIKKLLPTRPELKVIITSATIDPGRFSSHFNDAPIVEVSGRTYLVEVRYRPIKGENEDEKDRDRNQALVEAVDELARQGSGDILVFLPGERDIRDTAETLRKHHPPSTEILPLYGRLSFAQQNQVFQPHHGRRIVLATNVAETSLTVPGIHYVIDTGLARISRYSYRSKVQRLPIEAISQASANQRAGRCGRVAPGVCIRLYSEDDYLARSEFTDPEILRTNLAAVILQMLILKLGQVEDYPFIDPPDERAVRDGFSLLHELGAINSRHKLTKLGYQLGRLPIDVRLGRMILAAEHYHCLNEVLIIASALAIQDPRERPLEHQQLADEKHAAFKDEQSDFVSFLKLWRFYQEQAKHLSTNKLRKLCQQNFLSYVRMREWWETYKQLHTIAKESQFKSSNKDADYRQLHQALLTGLLGNIAQYDDKFEYTGMRGLKLYLFPGSGVFKKKPRWVVAAELVETGKRYARTIARIEPEWIEPLAEHLLKRSYSDPHWEKKRGSSVVYEQVSLYGLILITKRPIDYSKINPEHARELFIHDALIQGKTTSRLAFFQHNDEAKQYVLDQEARCRRRDLLIDEQSLFDHFNQVVPDEVCTMQAFETWFQKQPETTQQHFYLDKNQLLQNSAAVPVAEEFPVSITVQDMEFPLSYRFDPEHPDDGVTVTIPLVALNQLRPESFEWLVPGLLLEKISALIKTLPKSLRRNFVPAPEYAKKCLSELHKDDSSLLEALAHQLLRLTGIEVPLDAWQPDALPRHLLMNFNVTNGSGGLIGAGRDLTELQKIIGARAVKSFTSLPVTDFERTNIADWDFADLPEYIEREHQGLTIRGYPALVAKGDDISMRLLDAPEKAEIAHRKGTIALYKKQNAKGIKYLLKNLPDIQTLSLHYTSLGSSEELKQEIVDLAIATALFDKSDKITKKSDFELNSAWADKQLVTIANNLCRKVADILATYHKVRNRLQKELPPQWLHSISDIQSQIEYLIYPGFITATPAEWLQELPRYVYAIEYRLDKLEQNPTRDQELLKQISPYWRQCLTLLQQEDNNRQSQNEFQLYRWLLEEFRVSLFAQALGTREKVSAKRLQQAWDAIPK